MPVAAKALIVPTVTSAARALKKVPGCNDSRRERATDNLQESSVLWRGFTSDREGDDEYNMHMAKNPFYAVCKITTCSTSEPL